jgi:hypothetical protein
VTIPYAGEQGFFSTILIRSREFLFASREFGRASCGEARKRFRFENKLETTACIFWQSGGYFMWPEGIRA